VSSPRRRKIRNALLTSIVGILVALLGAELTIRIALFHPGVPLGALGASLRDPGRYSDGNSEDDYWKIAWLQRAPAARTDGPGADPIVGWTGPSIAPGTYAHAQEGQVGDRQLVLLFGDSFAYGVGRGQDRFQAILERSDLGQRYALLNYGVGGYGPDQVYLLLERALDRFAARDPIVIVSLLMEGDMERSVLSFRSWPKPRLDLVNGALVARGPVETNAAKYIAEHPLTIRSYLWRLFRYRRSAFQLDERIEAEKQSLNRQILIEIERELSRRKLRHFFLVFHNERGALKAFERFAWQEKLLHDVCAELSIPLVDTRTYLSFAADGRPELCAQLYGHGEPLNGHHSALGNLVCFEAIRQGLSGKFDAPDFSRIEKLKQDGPPDSGNPKQGK